VLSRLSYAFGISVAGLAHLAVIPILSLYGVSICPVLGEHGFVFGCKYNAGLVGGVLLMNAALTLASVLGLRAFQNTRSPAFNIVRWLPLLSVFSHLCAFAAGAYFLTLYLDGLDVPGPSLERMNTAYLYTAVLLSILQGTIVDWLTQKWLRSNSISHLLSSPEKSLGLGSRWLLTHFWNTLPLAGALLIGWVFLKSKLAGFQDETVDAAFVQKTLAEISQVGCLLVGWIACLRFFQFLKEKQLVDAVHAHLKTLEALKSEHRTSTVASGYWHDIFKALNHTSEVLGQRARLMRGFTSYVTDSVVQKVLRNEELHHDGELHHLAILVSDLRGFTTLSNTLAPEKVVQLLNIYFADMIEVLTNHGIVLDKFIGDGILAYVDPELNHPRPSVLAFEAALAMRAKLAETNLKLAAHGLPHLKLGVGVHFGPVILGSIGAPEKMQHTIIGDAVNVTARLESLCKELESDIIASDEVFQALDPAHQAYFTDLGAQEIRGLSQEVRLHGVRSKLTLLQSA
jgi:class 3 adenylate cyclase